MLLCIVSDTITKMTLNPPCTVYAQITKVFLLSPPPPKTGTSLGAVSPTRKEQPLFTLRQVGMICERLLKEREDKVREEYEETMTSKLAGRYLVIDLANTAFKFYTQSL